MLLLKRLKKEKAIEEQPAEEPQQEAAEEPKE